MATYYVDATRPDDSGNGLTIPTAKRTLNAGVGLLSSGDTLIVKAGTYNEALNNNTIPSGTTIQAATGESPTMVGNVWISAKSNITWDGININGINNGIPSSDGNQEAFTNFYINGGTNITCKNCEIYNASKLNILTGDGNAQLNNIQFINLKVHDPGKGGWTSATEPANHNFYIAASHVMTGPIIIDGCESYNALGPGPNSWGIQVYAAVPGYLNGVIIRNCYVHDNMQAIVVGSGPNHKVYNNVIFRNDLPGSYQEPAITIGYGSYVDNIQVYNNTIIENGSAYAISTGSGFGDIPTNTIIKNNIFWQNGTDGIKPWGATGTVSSNNFVGDPLFVTPGSDFHLQATSGAIGYGVNLSSIFTTDKAGSTRPASGAWDAGAYAYANPTIPPVATNPTLSVTNSPQTFNGNPQAANVISSAAGTVSNIKYNGSSTVPSAVGTYAITANFAALDPTHYNSLTAASAGNFIIGDIAVSPPGSPPSTSGLHVWPVLLFSPLGIRRVFSNALFDFGDGYEQRATKSQVYSDGHPDGLGAITTGQGLWEFSISLTAIAHANTDPTQEVNKLWAFAIQQLTSFEPFYFYNPLEAPTIDLTGTSTTGRYTVRFKDNLVSLENFMMRLHRGNLVLIEVRS